MWLHSEMIARNWYYCRSSKQFIPRVVCSRKKKKEKNDDDYDFLVWARGTDSAILSLKAYHFVE